MTRKIHELNEYPSNDALRETLSSPLHQHIPLRVIAGMQTILGLRQFNRTVWHEKGDSDTSPAWGASFGRYHPSSGTVAQSTTFFDTFADADRYAKAKRIVLLAELPSAEEINGYVEKATASAA